jgi:hypothetical protein
MLQIKKAKDTRTSRAFTHKLADIPGGVTVSTADFAGKVLQEGTAVGKDPVTGLFHIVKVAVLSANAANDAVAYTVKKGHQFKVGDFITSGENTKAYAITAIATNGSDATSDDLTVGTTLGVALTAANGVFIYQATAQAATNVSALKYEPVAIVGESYDVPTGGSLQVNAWTIAQVREILIPALGPVIKGKLKGISFI